MVPPLLFQILRYEDELEAQVLALESLSMERETARSAAQEAVQRATGLAAEVVALEQVGGWESCRRREVGLIELLTPGFTFRPSPGGGGVDQGAEACALKP